MLIGSLRSVIPIELDGISSRIEIRTNLLLKDTLQLAHAFFVVDFGPHVIWILDFISRLLIKSEK